MIEQLDKAGFELYPRSVVEANDTTYFLARGPEGKGLGIIGDRTSFVGKQGDTALYLLTPANAATLRGRLPWLRPQPLGLARSAGCGDRLGLATPGHLRALRQVGGLAPILAQQSMRENARTGRTPQQVIDDATWGIFQEGWRAPWGADADHLKTTQDVDLCVAAGYTFYTVDPGEYVDNAAHTDPEAVLRAKWERLPWADGLADSPDNLRARYLGRPLAVEGLKLEFDEVALLRAACKYGRAVAHTVALYRHLAGRMAPGTFELEVSVDETETPTTPLEHWFIAAELKRLGVCWISLAPRYIGRFEKGVDYIGDLEAFAADFARHAAIARVLGPYKLSLHSGSDKFSIYPLVARHAGELVHLKTAGTSYLEALRALAGTDPSLFRQILALAHERYERDRASYHVSANRERVPLPEALADADLAGVLNSFDGRQLPHVTFGSVLERFGPALKASLADHEEAYYQALDTHFQKHFLPLVLKS